MYKAFIFATVTLLLSLASFAQGNAKSPVLKKVISFEITDEGGANGASVAWHPVRKYYYTAMAGNASYPMVVFDAKGKRVFDDALETKFDVRGLWYNPFTKALQTNGYSENGWGEYQLLENGKPSDINVLYEGMLQPDAQSVGSYDPVKNMLYFYTEDGGVDQYSVKVKKYIKSIPLKLGRTKTEADDFDNDLVIEDYNNVAVYTGIKGSEIGMLNVAEMQIELYSLTDGFQTKIIKLPEDAPVNSMFNFSYTNNTWFLFDKENRTWLGYK